MCHAQTKKADLHSRPLTNIPYKFPYLIGKIIKDLKAQQRTTHSFTRNMNSPWIKPLEVFNEPYLCIPLQNLFLYFPGCISVDQSGDHIYISDSNHHRIIVFDAHGGIQDFIGSSPGFEDGDFENAKFMRPTLWTQSLWTLWVMDLASGTLKEIVRGVEATDSVLRSL